MRNKKWILISLSAIVLLPLVLIAAALAYLASADLRQHRDLIAGQLSDVIGRRVSLAGAFELNLASTTSLVVGDISVGNAAWALDPEMLRVQRVEVAIKLLPLLRGDIHVLRFHLEGVTALLETDRSGHRNWVLMESAAPTAAETESAAADFKLPWLREVYIGDVEVTYRDAQSAQEVVASLDHARIEADTPASPVAIDVVAQVDEYPFEVSGRFALPAVLSAEQLEVPVELQAKVFDLEVDGRGKISGDVAAPAVDLGLQAKAQSLEQLRQVFGDSVPQVKAVKLAMQVKADEGQPVAFDLDASAGEASLTTTLKLMRDPPRPKVQGEIAINDVDATRLWAPLFSGKPAAAVAEEADNESTSIAAQLDQALPLAWLDTLDADVKLSAKHIKLPQTQIDSLHSHLVIDERRLTIDPLELTTAAGRVTTTLSLDASDSRHTAARFSLKTTTLKLASVPGLAENERFKHSRAEADIDVLATGETAADMLDTMQGEVQLDYHDKQRNERLALNLARKPDPQARDEARLHVIADGTLDQQPIELRGHVVPPSGSLKGQKPYKIDFALKGFGIDGKIDGTAVVPYSLDGMDLALQVHAKNLQGVRQAFGDDIPDIGKVDLNTRFKGEPSKLMFSKLRLDLGGGRVEGWLSVDTAAAVPGLKAKLAFVDLDLNRLLPAQPAQLKTQKTEQTKTPKGKVFPDQPLPFDALSHARIDATLQFVNVAYNDRRLQDGVARIILANSKLKLALLKLSAVKSELVGNLVVDASNKDAPVISLTLKAPHVELGEIFAVDDGTSAIEGPLAVDLHLEGKGNSVAQIMASLNGNARLLGEQGSANAKALDLFVGGLSAMFGTIFTEDSSKTRIECAIYDMEFEQGIVSTRLAVLDTQYSTVITEGQVNLGQEQLDLKVTPQAKGVTLSVAFPVLVKGTLSAPNIDVEKSGALMKAGELLATVAYPPAALLQFSDLGDGKGNPCVTLVAEKAGVRIIDDAGKAVKGAVEGTGKVVKGVGGRIKEVGSGLGKLLGKDKDDAEADADSDSETHTPSDEDLEDEDLFDDD